MQRALESKFFCDKEKEFVCCSTFFCVLKTFLHFTLTVIFVIINSLFRLKVICMRGVVGMCSKHSNMYHKTRVRA